MPEHTLPMIIVSITELSDKHKMDLCSLWNNEYPAQLAYADTAAFGQYLDTLTDMAHQLLVSVTGEVMGWAMSFSRDGQRWFLIILDRIAQRRGYGGEMLNHMKNKEAELHGWATHHNNYTKQDGSPYVSPLGFYLKNGFLDTGTWMDTEQLSAVRIKWKQ